MATVNSTASAPNKSKTIHRKVFRTTHSLLSLPSKMYALAQAPSLRFWMSNLCSIHQTESYNAIWLGWIVCFREHIRWINAFVVLTRVSRNYTIRPSPKPSRLNVQPVLNTPHPKLQRNTTGMDCLQLRIQPLMPLKLHPKSTELNPIRFSPVKAQMILQSPLFLLCQVCARQKWHMEYNLTLLLQMIHQERVMRFAAAIRMSCQGMRLRFCWQSLGTRHGRRP